MSSQASTLLDVVRRRRSVRAFDPDRPVADEVLDTVFEMARWAPSAGNSQPWEFIVIRDAEMRSRIYGLYEEQAEAKDRVERIRRGHQMMTTTKGFRNAPVYIIVLGDPRTTASFPTRTQLEKARDHYIASLAHADLIVHLGIAAHGLVSQWVSDASSPLMHTALKSWLYIPDHMQVYSLTAVGYPASARSRPTPRREVDEIVHHDSYSPEKARDQEQLDAFLWTQSWLATFGRRRHGRPDP